jgi:hypothetical protein
MRDLLQMIIFDKYIHNMKKISVKFYYISQILLSLICKNWENAYKQI